MADATKNSPVSPTVEFILPTTTDSCFGDELRIQEACVLFLFLFLYLPTRSFSIAIAMVKNPEMQWQSICAAKPKLTFCEEERRRRGLRNHVFTAQMLTPHFLRTLHSFEWKRMHLKEGRNRNWSFRC